jgi:putative addiction module component (TIGR02574 family)
MMSETQKELLHDVMSLSPLERAQIVDEIMLSLDQPDEKIDALWKEEIESRISAYEKGDLKTVSLNDVLSKYSPS